MIKEDSFKFINSRHKDMLDLWNRLVSMDSGSEYKLGVNAVAAALAVEFENSGAETRLIEFQNAGNMLIAEVGKDRTFPPILLMGHMDTVFPVGSAEARPFTIKDGYGYGPGILDMKGGITQIVFTIRALEAAGYRRRPIKVILAGDEECGHFQSNAPEIIENESRGCVACFNCETGWVDEGIVIGRKGAGRFDLEIHGVSAHPAYDWDKGRSAIREMSHKVIELEALTDWEKSGITVNVGTIQGGSVPNQVPNLCKASIDFRYGSIAQAQEIMEKITVLAHKTFIDGTETTLSGGLTFLPMETTAAVMALFDLVKQTARELGLKEPYPKSVGGASDSAYSIRAGVPTVCAMGPKGNLNHSENEYVIVDSLFERTKLLIASILNIG